MTLYTDVRHGDRSMRVIDLKAILGSRLEKLPHVLRLLSENHLRETRSPAPLIAALDDWLAKRPTRFEFSFRPNRILMHDTTCTPAIADIAGLRDAIAEAGGDPAQLTPQLPVEVSVDHSLAVDIYANAEAATRNSVREIERNRERYAFMKWASANLKGVHVNPPGTGIMHTINLEQLATVLEINDDGTAHPDMLLGTDSHTPMINGIGVLGWGIGGLEAESVMFGQATTLAVPKVVGVRLVGALRAGTLSTDLALYVTQRLRELDVTGAFVEFFGPGVANLTAGDRAVIANMAPEYGASTGLFPVDANSVTYLAQTARDPQLTRAIEPVFRAMGLWFDPEAHPCFDQEIEIDLSSLAPAVAGPRRPQDLCAPEQAPARIESAISRPLEPYASESGEVPDGAVGVAAITSCTNTSDPRLLVTAGLLARKAAQRGLTVPHWVKTSLAPGSPSARAYLDRAGLAEDLASLGFDIVGFGCTTCIGNSGPLPAVIETALEQGKAVCAVLSGNRNFPGRVHPKLDLGYLASPPLVVAYAIKGRVDGDILSGPLGEDANGAPVYLNDIWPAPDEIDATVRRAFRASDVPQAFATASGNQAWQDIECPNTLQFPWDKTSRNLRRPKFASLSETTRLGHYSAAPLLVLGDDMTTDHISPAGWISPDSEAGKWLIERGGTPADLNVYASYRGNWEVMLRGLFTNRLARNHLADNLPAGWTILEDGTRMPVHRAATYLERTHTPVVILAGERYGMGSSRDWAAKGAALLGTRAIIARSFERIHRQNLIGMGVVPLVIMDDFGPSEAGISARDRFDISLPQDALTPNQEIALQWRPADSVPRAILCRADVQTEQEVALLRAGGVLASILKRVLGDAPYCGTA
ncbi:MULTISPECIES: aconitate hydratase AcnA [Alphaproteobacteria]|uniref:aconitate hydratase AcnA n=1 Tax=Alphaproteobacteria TaxID=28211 RepID=UPI003A8D898A